MKGGEQRQTHARLASCARFFLLRLFTLLDPAWPTLVSRLVGPARSSRSLPLPFSGARQPWIPYRSGTCRRALEFCLPSRGGSRLRRVPLSPLPQLPVVDSTSPSPASPSLPTHLPRLLLTSVCPFLQSDPSAPITLRTRKFITNRLLARKQVSLHALSSLHCMPSDILSLPLTTS